MQLDIIAAVLHLGQAANQFALVDAITAHQVQHHLEIFVRIAQPVDRRNGSHDQRIAAFEQGLGRRQPHLLDVLVDVGILLDIGVGGRDIRFGLVVVVVADEVFHCVVREELLELAIQLRRQRLVWRHHQGRFLHRLHQVGDGISLA